MSSSRRPWYPWYPKEFTADEKVRSLTDDAELLYRRVLDCMWEASAVHLPNISSVLHNQIARGWTKERFEIAWAELIRPGFEIIKVTDDGKNLYSTRLLKEAQKIETISKIKRENALKAKVKHKLSKSKADAKHQPSHPYPDPNSTKDALSKDKAGDAPPLPSKLPLPGSKHYTNKIPNVQQVEKLCLEIKEIGNCSFNPYQFVQRCANENKHPSAIYESLEGILKAWPEIKNHWTYAMAIIKTKSGNYNEADHRKQTEDFKKKWNDLAKEVFG